MYYAISRYDFFVVHFLINLTLVHWKWWACSSCYLCILLRYINVRKWYCTFNENRCTQSSSKYMLIQEVLKGKEKRVSRIFCVVVNICYVLLKPHSAQWWLYMTKKPDSILFNQMNPMIWEDMCSLKCIKCTFSPFC